MSDTYRRALEAAALEVVRKRHAPPVTVHKPECLCFGCGQDRFEAPRAVATIPTAEQEAVAARVCAELVSLRRVRDAADVFGLAVTHLRLIASFHRMDTIGGKKNAKSDREIAATLHLIADRIATLQSALAALDSMNLGGAP